MRDNNPGSSAQLKMISQGPPGLIIFVTSNQIGKTTTGQKRRTKAPWKLIGQATAGHYFHQSNNNNKSCRTTSIGQYWLPKDRPNRTYTHSNPGTLGDNNLPAKLHLRVYTCSCLITHMYAYICLLTHDMITHMPARIYTHESISFYR